MRAAGPAGAADGRLTRVVLQFSVFVERVFPWWEAREAYERAAEGSARGKLLLDFTAQRHD